MGKTSSDAMASGKRNTYKNVEAESASKSATIFFIISLFVVHFIDIGIAHTSYN